MAGGHGAAGDVGIGPARQGDAVTGPRQPIHLLEDAEFLAAPVGAELGVQHVQPLAVESRAPGTRHDRCFT